jgi:hypothetical protein
MGSDLDDSDRIENLEAAVIGLTQKLLMMEAVLGQVLLGRTLSISKVDLDHFTDDESKEMKN